MMHLHHLRLSSWLGSIRNTAAAKSQPLPDVSRISDQSGPSGAIAGVPTQNPIHQYGAVTIFREPDMAGFQHSIPAPATAAAAETGTVSRGNLLDTVSDSVSLGLASQMSHQPEPALAPQVEGNFQAMALLLQRENASDARADQADNRLVDMAKDVKGTHQALASLLAQGRAAASSWDALQHQLDRDRRSDAAIFEQRLALNASFSAEQHNTAMAAVRQMEQRTDVPTGNQSAQHPATPPPTSESAVTAALDAIALMQQRFDANDQQTTSTMTFFNASLRQLESLAHTGTMQTAATALSTAACTSGPNAPRPGLREQFTPSTTEGHRTGSTVTAVRHGAPEQPDRYYVEQPRLESQPRTLPGFGEERNMDIHPFPGRRSMVPRRRPDSTSPGPHGRGRSKRGRKPGSEPLSLHYPFRE